MGISIKNDRAERLARQVSAETGKALRIPSSTPWRSVWNASRGGGPLPIWPRP